MPEINVAKILVVDDEAELKNALVEALSAQSFEVRGFTSGARVLSALREEAFDVLISDLMMPEIDGITLIEKALEIDPHLVTIIMTGQGTIQTAVDAMKMGAFDYVLKPFRLATLLPTLTRAINTRRLRLENMQLRETVAIYELCQTIAFSLDKQTLISKLADAVLQQTQADEVSILLPTKENKELYVAAVRGESHQRLLGERVPLEETISGWVAHQREPLLLTGEVNDVRFHPVWPNPEIKSAISIPIQIGNKLIGTININAIDRPRPFTLGQMKALTILASTAAAALESASLYSQIEDQQQRLDNIVATVPGVVWEAWGEPDAATQRIDFVSGYVETMLGYSVEEWLATPNFWLTIVHPDDREEAARVAAQGFATGQNCTMEFRWLAKDGHAVWVESSWVVVKDEHGEPAGLRGVNTDISERKRAEEAVRASEAEMRAVFASMTDVILVFDSEGRHLKVAPTKTKHLYVPAAERLGKTVHEVFPKDKADFFLAQIHAALAQERTQRVEYNLEINGEEFWYDGSVSPMTKDTVVWVARDVTDGKRAEEVLRESEATFKDLFDDAPVAYHEIDNEGRFMRVNHTEQQLLGYTAEEMQGRFAWEFIVEKVSREAVGKKLSGKASLQPFERTFIRKDGTFVPMEIQDRLLYDADGKICGIRSTLHDITERKRAEEALRLSEESYRDLVENAQDIIYSHDLKGNYTSVNKAGELITGYSREEALKLNLLEMVAPQHVAKAKEMLRRKLAGESTTAYEIEILAKDGRRVPLEVSTRLMLENGVPVGITGIARDITERKKAEAELRFQKSLLESQTEASTDGVLVVSPAGEVLSFNHRFLQLWGIEEEGILGKPDREAMRSVLNLVKTPQQFLERVQYLYEHPDERSEEEIELIDGRTLERHSAAVHGPQGEHYGRVWFFRDITERKLAQAELTRLATAVNQTADSIVITDTAGNIEYVNPAFELVTGYTKEEAVGKNPRMLKSGANPPSIYEDLWATITGGDVWVGQLINKRKDGSLFNERATISAVRDEAGKIAHFIAVKRDTTHENQLEDQLRQSQKMEAIGQLAGGVAHDFNNLLTAISGYTSLAIQRIDEHNPITPYLEEVKKAGDRAANLTRQLLAFGRKQILQPIPLDLNSIVSDMNKMLRRLIGEDINLTAKLAGDLKRIKADPGQVEQVLVNLVVNARDAMPQGGSLTIETANVELDREYARGHVGVHPGNYVMLAVSDTGSGMSEETRARIFEPFFTTKEKGKGTGLGLSTVYGIIQQSGGSIWVYSELNQGTSFKVYLPQLDAPAKAPEEKAKVEEVPRGSETILLVEDEEVVRGLATHILEDAGYKVLKAKGGNEAIELCTEGTEQIDLLLTDVVMPETSGKEVAERVTALMPHLKVLFMSGYTDEAIVHHGVLDSNVEFIQKPFTPLGLSKKVREVLDSNGHGHRG